MPYAAYAGALCLDGPTLTNLELLEGSTGSSEGSLLSCLDTCASAGTLTCCDYIPWSLRPTACTEGDRNPHMGCQKSRGRVALAKDDR